MTEQTNSAAERSAHVTRDAGPAAPTALLHPVRETKNELGQTVGEARGVAELREQVARIKATLATMLDHVDYTSGACGPTEMVAAALPAAVIRKARAVLAEPAA